MIRKFTLYLLLPAITLTLLFLADKVLLKFYTVEYKPENDYIFELPSKSTAVYQGPEFKYLAKTNSLGFRGREYHKPKAVNTIRVLAIGDSFTFGNGSNEKDIWISLLEKKLGERLNNKKIEIFNLGQPGTGPYKYLENVKKYLPFYDPDILLIGIVEGEDIGQLIIWPEKQTTQNLQSETAKKQLLEKIDRYSGIKVSLASKTKKISEFFGYLFPFFYSRLAPYKVIDLRPANMSVLKDFINYMGVEELIYFETKISQEVQNLYLKGDLNPNLLSLAVSKSDFFTAFTRDDDQKVKVAVENLTAIISQINAIAVENGTIPFIVDIPYGLFVVKDRADTLVKMGFQYSGTPWISQKPIELLKKVASPSGMIVIDNLAYFRDKCSSDCFFRYDGHFTSKGNKLLADSLEIFLSDSFKNLAL